MNHGALTDSSSYDLRGKVRYVYSAALRGTAELNMSYTGLGAVSGFTNTGVAGGFPVEEFITDGLGNRTERKQSGGASDPFDPDRRRRFFYDSWNRLYEMDSPSANPLQFDHRESYQYDGAGNTRYSYIFERPSSPSQLRHDASASYYGGDNKLRVYNRHIGINAQSDDSTAGRRGTFDEYRYDALGRRVLTRTRKLGFGCDPVFVDCASVATRTVWDGDRVLYEIRAPGGEFVTNQGDTIAVTEIESDSYTGGAQGLTFGRVAYTHAPGVTGIDEPIAITRMGSTAASVPNPMTVYPHTGWRGMLAVGTMSNGNVSDCGYSGSGTCAPIDWPAIDATVDRGPSGSNEPQSWFGSLASAYSEGSGLSYKRNRYYDPNRGQFTQADPIGLAGGLNVYGFAEGDPVNFDDPFGLCTRSTNEDGSPSDCERLARFVEQLAARAASDREFIQRLGELVAGFERGNSEGDADRPTVQFGNTGFRGNLVDDRNPSRHYAAYVVTGFQKGHVFAAGAAVYREACRGPACSIQDVWLGMVGAGHGSLLSSTSAISGGRARFRLANWIRREL